MPLLLLHRLLPRKMRKLLLKQKLRKTRKKQLLRKTRKKQKPRSNLGIGFIGGFGLPIISKRQGFPCLFYSKYPSE